MTAMPLLDVRNNDQKLADAAAFHEQQMCRAARTVEIRVTDPAARQELLECLGLVGSASAG